MIQDRGLGIALITLSDLLDEEPSAVLLDGITIRPCLERVPVHRFPDGKIKDGPTAGVSFIKFWIVLDCGEDKNRRFIPPVHSYSYDVVKTRRHRYLPVGVSVEHDISDVEMEENGVALPGTYKTMYDAIEVSSDLCACNMIHES